MAAELTERVYALVRMIPAGCVASYGQLAALAGHARAARIVGGIMGACRDRSVPCHRVVYVDGALAPGDAFGVPGLQRKMLEDEGVCFTGDGRVEMQRHCWKGSR